MLLIRIMGKVGFLGLTQAREHIVVTHFKNITLVSPTT